MDGVKITVMKTEFYSDLVKDVDQDVQTETFGSCPIFKVGDVFIIKDVDTIPNGFCSWAWADIERDVAMILFGAKPQPYLRNRHSMYSCCDEGLRPVVFKIERIELNSPELSILMDE